MRAIMEERGDYRVLKCDIIRREITDMVAELQARSCSIDGSEADLKDCLLRKVVKQIPALDRRMPLFAIDEAHREDQLLVDLVEREQQSATRASASAALPTPAQPPVVGAGV